MKTISIASFSVFYFILAFGVTAQVFVNESFSLSPPVNTYDTYFWDFGDGTPTIETSDTTIEHMYVASGDYQVLLISKYFCVSDSTIKSDTTINTISVRLNFNNYISYGPNPYFDNCNITYTLPNDYFIHIFITDENGNIVCELVNEFQTANDYNYIFSAKQLGYPAGIYYLECEVDDQIYYYQLQELP